MSKSLFGSVKDKFSRKSSSYSKSTTPSMGAPPTTNRSTNPFSNPAPAPQVPSRESDTPVAALKPTDIPALVIDEAPPAYTANASTLASSSASALQPGIRGASPAPSLASITNDNDQYAFLATFDTVFLIDDSGSMAGSLWREVDAALRAITPLCTQRDRDGIDLYFLNHRSVHRAEPGKAPGGYYNIRSAQTVEEIFRRVSPGKLTPTGNRLESILRPYNASLASAKDPADVKPVNIIVITDGVPTDDPEGVIVQHAKKLDTLDAPASQVGIQFFQVGSDRGAKTALRELDDELASQGVRDIVDTVTWDGTAGAREALTADGILKVVLGAVVRRLDRRATTNNQRSRT